MHCQECERLSRVEIELTRGAAQADARLQQFCPEAPFGAAVLTELRGFERKVEEARACLLRSRAERKAHVDTHALTIGI